MELGTYLTRVLGFLDPHGTRGLREGKLVPWCPHSTAIRWTAGMPTGLSDPSTLTFKGREPDSLPQSRRKWEQERAVRF